MSRTPIAHLLVVLLAATWCVPSAFATDDAELSAKLAALDPNVLSAEQRKEAVERYTRHFNDRIKAASKKSTEEWKAAISQKDATGIEALLKQSRDGLRKSLGLYQQPTEKLEVHVTKTIPGEGFAIENVLFTSGRGLWITANLYRPEPRTESMPGILICHAHHTPKSHEELQDMGMTWARMGCLVLVMDQLGHGERRQHPFRTAKDYPKEFRPSRQDYWFRYDNALELDLVGESLIGWMAWDLMRGVDLLLARPGIDPKRIALLGSVAGGGDPAAVAAALDERISVAVPFNFGGPQPETRFPLPLDAEETVNFAGSGGWESTRNLRGSVDVRYDRPNFNCWGPDDRLCRMFLPWQIVGSIAPRKLIYAHEFAWDREHDPVWKRLETIYARYNVRDGLDFTHGAGSVRGSTSTDTHCTHIGKLHRQRIHEALARWWGLPNGVEREYKQRVPFEDLLALTPEWREKLQPKSLSARLGELADQRLAASRKMAEEATQYQKEQRPKLPGEVRKGPSLDALNLRPSLSDLKTLPGPDPEKLDWISVERITFQDEHGLSIPLLMFSPPRHAVAKNPPPVVVAIAQEGKQGFLKHRAGDIVALLKGGAAVCLPDLRGTGETRAGNGRDRTSGDTSYSSSEQMLGDTLAKARLGDLLSVMRYLVGKDGRFKRCALWGDSFAEANPADVNLAVPYGVDARPRQAEPLGGLLAIVGALRARAVVDAVYVSGGLTSYRSVLDSPFVYIPHDAVIPGQLSQGDLVDLAALLAPLPLRLDNLVDGQNRLAKAHVVQAAYQPAAARYKELKAADKFSLGDETTPAAQWLLRQLEPSSQ